MKRFANDAKCTDYLEGLEAEAELDAEEERELAEEEAAEAASQMDTGA